MCVVLWLGFSAGSTTAQSILEYYHRSAVIEIKSTIEIKGISIDKVMLQPYLGNNTLEILNIAGLQFCKEAYIVWRFDSRFASSPPTPKLLSDAAVSFSLSYDNY